MGGDDPDTPKPIPLPPSHGADDAYDVADYRAGVAAGLTDQAALAMAKGNYREKTISAGGLDRNKTETNDATRTGAPAFRAPPRTQETDLGDRLGNGGTFKDAYFYKPDPSKVVLTMRDTSRSGDTAEDRELTSGNARRDVEDEVKYLNELKNREFRVVQNYGITEKDGHPAIILDYIDGISSKNILEPDSPAMKSNGIKFLNENSIRDLEEIKQRLDKENMFILDLQFMIDRDGHVLINDPMGLSRSAGIDPENRNDIDALISIAKRKMGGN